MRTIRQEFLPRTEQNQIDVRVVLPNGTPIEATETVAETILGRAREMGDGEGEARERTVAMTFARIGESPGVVDTQTEDPDGPNTADLIMRLAEPKPGRPAVRSSEVVTALRPEVDRLPDAKVEFRMGQGTLIDLLGSSPAPLLIEISGDELEVLTLLAAEIQARLQMQPGLLNVRTNILEGSPEVLVNLDKVQLGRLGFDIQSVANTIRRRIEGEDAGLIKRDTGDVDIRVQVDYGREDLEVLGDIVLRSPTGALVPLRTVADFRIERGPREIVRRHQERVARVMADLEGVKLSDAIAESRERLESLRLPGGYMLRFTGEEEQRAEAFEKLQFALILSIILVYMVMASIFESFLQPLLIMITIPMAAVGVVGAFLLTGQTLNVMALIGVIMLGGIVVNNAIVLLDCVNQVRRDAAEAGEEISSRDSLLIGCERRLRPVLMTTATTLLGLLPLALGFGEGAELRQAMAVAVLGGLLSSTVLTLLIIPVAQSYLDSTIVMVRRALGIRKRGRGNVETALP
jgi:HAE1 family hydrophobic/amphiphilic exporter-1